MTQRNEMDPEAVERRMANRDLGRAYKTVKLAGLLCWATAGLTFVCWLSLSFIWAAREGGSFIIGFAAAGLLFGPPTLLLVVTATQMRKYPMVGLVIAAIFDTLISIWGLAIGGGGVIQVTLLLAAAGCWASVAVVAPVRRLIKEHPDLRITKRFTGELPDAEPGQVTKRARSRRRAGRMTPLTIGMVSLVIVSSAATIFLITQPQKITDSVDEFDRALASRDMSAIEELIGFEGSRSDKQSRREKTIGVLEAQSWHESTARLGKPAIKDSESVATVTYDPPNGRLVVRWRLDDREWVIDAISWSRKTPTSLDAALQQFAQHVRQGDLTSLLLLARESKEEKIERFLKRRGFQKPGTTLSEPAMERRSDTISRARYGLEGRTMTVTWVRRDTGWQINGMSLR